VAQTGSAQLPDLNADQIARWADRIAEGEDEFPAELSQLNRDALAEAVRARLRERLLHLIAGAVAHRMVKKDGS